MIRVHSCDRYDYYIGSTNFKDGCSQRIYNIVPRGTKEPASGYPNMQYIEDTKGVKFPDRYQPTLHGMRNLYQ